tara:strand:+ start:13827 stop:16484 length:2658 start_codon:yes stop_codon:yes gene_type:complete
VPATQEDARLFLVGICSAIAFTQTYDNTYGKRVLWMIFLGLVSECSEFYDRAMQQNFINYSIKILNCQHGVIVATTRDYQININLFIPCSEDTSKALHTWMVTRLQRDFFDYAIDLRPILRFITFPEPHTWPRRMMPSARRLQDFTYDDVRRVIVFEDYISPITEVVTDLQRLSKYRPVRRMEMTDDAETLYWHRFDCGTIVGFHNPYVDLHESGRVPIMTSPFVSNLTPICKKVVCALEPSHATECIDIIETKCITLEARRIFVGIHKSKFGITDELIVAVGIHLGDSLSEHSKNLLLVEFSIIYETMSKFATEFTAYMRLLEGLMNWLERFQDIQLWRHWLLTSPFMHLLVSKVPTQSMRRVCRHHPVLYHLMAATLCCSHPNPSKWTRETTERAHAVCDAANIDEGGEYIESLRNMYDVWTQGNTQAFDELSFESVDSKVSLTPSATSSQTRLTEISLDSEVVSPTKVDTISSNPFHQVYEDSRTHDDVVARIASVVFDNNYECTLIGSGIFYDGSDVDIVVRVPDVDTLEIAYELVERLTGWHRQYDRVSTERISVLRGEFEGLKVDAQVWRGVHSLERTRSEEETFRALTLTRVLRENTDIRLRCIVHEFHVFMDHLGFKGHCLCRLPGVSVTCMAIVVARNGNSYTLSSILEEVRTHLETDVPCFDFDGEDYHTVSQRHRNRPSCAVQVIVNEMNTASRMTASVTRHLLDTVAWSLHNMTMSPRAWRAGHMITCLRMRPHHDSSRTIALTLHTSMSKMDGHPLVDTAYADEHPETGDILVRVTLRRDARYGFYGTETITRISGTESIVMVSRTGGSRQWPLCTHPCTISASRSMAPCVANVVDEMFVRVDGDLCVPNAPHLLSDLLGYFDTRHWMRVDV